MGNKNIEKSYQKVKNSFQKHLKENVFRFCKKVDEENLNVQENSDTQPSICRSKSYDSFIPASICRSISYDSVTSENFSYTHHLRRFNNSFEESNKSMKSLSICFSKSNDSSISECLSFTDLYNREDN